MSKLIGRVILAVFDKWLGVEFRENGIKQYEGEFKDGQREGKGKDKREKIKRKFR